MSTPHNELSPIPYPDEPKSESVLKFPAKTQIIIFFSSFAVSFIVFSLNIIPFVVITNSAHTGQQSALVPWYSFLPILFSATILFIVGIMAITVSVRYKQLSEKQQVSSKPFFSGYLVGLVTSMFYVAYWVQSLLGD